MLRSKSADGQLSSASYSQCHEKFGNVSTRLSSLKKWMGPVFDQDQPTEELKKEKNLALKVLVKMILLL